MSSERDLHQRSRSPLAHHEELELVAWAADSREIDPGGEPAWIRIHPGQAVCTIGRERIYVCKVWFGERHGLQAPTRFRREEIALQLAHAGGAPVPCVLGTNASRNWLLMSHIPCELGGSWPSPESIGAVLGRLHAATVGDTAMSRRTMAPWRALPTRSRLASLLSRCGVADLTANAFADRIANVAAQESGPSAVSHGDLVASNFLGSPSELYLCDFELSALAPAARDIACAALAFPTAIEPIEYSVDEFQRLCSAYELAFGNPEPIQAPHLSSAAAWWICLMLGTHLPDLEIADRQWGPVTVRQRVVRRLALFAALEGAGLAGDLAVQVLSSLADSWHLDPELPLSSA